MISTLHEFLSIVSVGEKKAEQKISANQDYLDTLEYVRGMIAQNHSEELAAALDDAAAVHNIKELIFKYAAEFKAGEDFDRDALVERIFEDMAGLGLLTKYLYDPTVEEININSFDCVEIWRPDRTDYLYADDAYPSIDSAVDIVKRMVRMGGMLLDAQTPATDSFISAGTRIMAMIPPLIPEECGVSASIRKQSKSRITKEQMIQYGTATEDILDFLTSCLCYGVSVGTAGGTGSGKSTLMTYLLNEYITKNEDFNNRIFVIEDSRELNLLKYDVENDRPARVIYTTTKSEPNPIDMYYLIAKALRANPNIIVPAEVRDGAAYQAALAGQTGHTILTSFHANSARDSYRRLVSMCHMAGTGQSDQRLLEMCIDAWPIIVCQKQLKDHTRKIMEVFEATGQKSGHVVGNMLYRFVIEDTERDGHGRITKVHGHHERCGCISPRLFSTLRDNGMPEEKLLKLFPEAKPEVISYEN